MKIEDLSQLNEQVSAIDGQRPERLAEVHGRIHQARRRRNVGVGMGAVALVAAAFLVISVVPEMGKDSAPSVEKPSQTVEPSAEEPEQLPDYARPRLTPGNYQFSVYIEGGTDISAALVDVPDGFSGGADWYVVSPDQEQFLGLMTVDEVERDACLNTANDSFAPGPSVEDLADALVAQKSTRASLPEPATLDGYQGLYVELTGPGELGRCDKFPALWREPGERGIYGDGQVDMLWILDVDGQRIVVDAAYSKSESAEAEIDTLTGMVDSLKFASPTQR